MRARLDPELLDQRRACRLVRRQRFRLATGAVERDDQLPAQRLTQRIPRDEVLDARHELSVPSELELRTDELLLREQPELLEPRRLGRSKRLELQIRERGAAPERKRAPESRRAFGRRLNVRLLHETLETTEIDVLGGDVEDVARRPGAQDVRAHELAQLRDRVLERVLRRRRRTLAPELVEEPVRRRDLAGVHEEEREHRPILRLSERNLALAVGHAQRAK